MKFTLFNEWVGFLTGRVYFKTRTRNPIWVFPIIAAAAAAAARAAAAPCGRRGRGCSRPSARWRGHPLDAGAAPASLRRRSGATHSTRERERVGEWEREREPVLLPSPAGPTPAGRRRRRRWVSGQHPHTHTVREREGGRGRERERKMGERERMRVFISLPHLLSPTPHTPHTLYPIPPIILFYSFSCILFSKLSNTTKSRYEYQYPVFNTSISCSIYIHA